MGCKVIVAVSPAAIGQVWFFEVEKLMLGFVVVKSVEREREREIEYVICCDCEKMKLVLE
jgi:hypothetical protein